MENNIRKKYHTSSEIYQPELVNYAKDLNEIKKLCIKLWGKGGEYSDNFYRHIINNQLSYAYKTGKKLIAVCLIGKSQRSNYIDLDILAVDPEYQGKGLGGSLLGFCLVNCMNYGYKNFQLHVATSNGRAIKLYKKFKFEKFGNKIENYYYNDPEGERDAYYMRLDAGEETIKEVKNQIKENEIRGNNIINFQGINVIYNKPNYNINNAKYNFINNNIYNQNKYNYNYQYENKNENNFRYIESYSSKGEDIKHQVVY